MSSLEMPHIRQQQQRESVITTGSEGKSRKSYPIEFKTQVINFYHAHAGNISLAAKMFGVDRKLVRSWVEQEDFFRGSLKTDAKPSVAVSVITQSPVVKPHSGSVVVAPPARETRTTVTKMPTPAGVKYPELDRAMMEWWMVQHGRGELPKMRDVRTQALHLFGKLYPAVPDTDIRASTGWLTRFASKMESHAHEKAKNHFSGGRRDYVDEERVVRSTAAPHSRAAPYPVADKLKPILPAPTTSVIVQRINADASNVVAVEGGGNAEYAYMSPQERDVMERQNQEASRFFQDIRDWLGYVEMVSARVSRTM